MGSVRCADVFHRPHALSLSVTLCQAALCLLTALVGSAPSALVGQLDAVLPKVMARVGDRKASTREAGLVLLKVTPPRRRRGGRARERKRG